MSRIECVCGHAWSSHRQDPVDPWVAERCVTCGCAGFDNHDERKMQSPAEAIEALEHERVGYGPHSEPYVSRRAVLGALTDSLDAAWAEAEAALRETAHQVRFLAVRQDVNGDDVLAWAYWRYVEDDGLYAEGPTPAAALRALAAKLKERAG